MKAQHKTNYSYITTFTYLPLVDLYIRTYIKSYHIFVYGLLRPLDQNVVNCYKKVSSHVDCFIYFILEVIL